MEQYPDLPSKLGARPVWLVCLETVAEWRQLLADRDWNELIEEKRQPFGLFTACPDSVKDNTAWAEFADHCVQRELRLTVSWGPDARALEDIFDDAYLGRHVDGLPTAEPLTASADEDALLDGFEEFLSYPGDDLRRLDDGDPPTEWVRVVLIVGEEPWLPRMRAVITELQQSGTTPPA